MSSFDALGSFVLSPLGAAIAGPVAAAAGTDNALWLAAGAIVACNITMLMMPAVWSIHGPTDCRGASLTAAAVKGEQTG